jgi:RNA polymerase sigma factor (TIGR02999 family)
MRHVLVDYARAATAAKRGGAEKPVPLEDVFVVSPDRMTEVLSLDHALTTLANLHPRQSQVVEMRFFGGFSVEETAEALRLSDETVMRDWRAAKAWLHRELARSDGTESRDDA